MDRPIILIGYRATGKTTVAQILAQQLQCSWFDSDLLIEEKAQKPISRIFAEEGEPKFRDWEALTIEKAFVDYSAPFVLATGGGAILRESTRTLLRQSGWVVWLTASEQTILERMTLDQTTKLRRPDLTGLPPLEEITHLLHTRNPLYEQTAHVQFCTEEATPELLGKRILGHKRASSEAGTPP